MGAGSAPGLLGVGRGAPGRPPASVVPACGGRALPIGCVLLASQYITQCHDIKGKPPLAVLRTLDITPLGDGNIAPAGTTRRYNMKYSIRWKLSTGPETYKREGEITSVEDAIRDIKALAEVLELTRADFTITLGGEHDK